MLGINKPSKTIDISIVDEKYYFPGQTIKGFVNVQPKHPTKTNHIHLKFIGEVSLSLKEKDTTCLFQRTKILNVTSDDKPPAKAFIMEPKLYTFPFEFVVPEDIQLPSTMEFNKKARVRYTLSALHDKPMVPESLCPKAEYPVHILEFIDINDKTYKVPQDKSSQMFLPKSNPMNRCIVRASLPRFGFTRGDIVPLSLVIHHYEPFCLSQAIDISLIRTVEIENNKNTQIKEDVLKSTKCDIEITRTPHFSQTMKRQLLIPTSTPPSIQFRDNLLRVQYKVRISAQLSNQQGDKDALHDICNVDIPIIVGTWPRASIPIDDDDDNDDNSVTMEEDTDFIEVANSISGTETNQTDYSDNRNSNSIQLSQQQHYHHYSSESRKSSTMESISDNSSSSTIKLTTKSSTISETGPVARSDSLASKSSGKSHASHSSYRSSQSWDKSSPSLSRNTSFSTNVSLPESSKNTSAIPVNVLLPTSETIVMSAAPSHNSNNRSVSPLYQHRGSDPTGMVNHATSDQHRHSFSERDPHYPVFIGPSPSKYQQKQPRSLSPPPYHGNSHTHKSTSSSSSSSITLLMASSPQPSATISSSSSSTSTSHLHDQSLSSLSTHRSLPITSLSPPPTVLSPVSSPSALFVSPPSSPAPSSNPIMLQPVNDIDEDDFIQRRTIDKKETSSPVSYPDLVQQSDSDSDDDDDDDFLAIVKRKQELNCLDEQTRTQRAEMKT
ncbi:unnamed protein product [Absidia cylindrospora]